jgi:hypothetical protein
MAEAHRARRSTAVSLSGMENLAGVRTLGHRRRLGVRRGTGDPYGACRGGHGTEG